MTANSEPQGRIRISLATGELEVDGHQDFVSQYAESIAALLSRLIEQGPTVVATVPAATAAASSGNLTGNFGTTAGGTSSPVDEPFGQVLHSLSSKSGTDQILLAGYYHAKTTPDGTFSTNEAHKLLIEQGVKLSNASQSMKNNLAAKRAFKVGSRFKVAKAGLDYLVTLGVSAA